MCFAAGGYLWASIVIVVDVLNFRHGTEFSAINDFAPPPVTYTPERRAIVIFACLLHSINDVFHLTDVRICVVYVYGCLCCALESSGG